MAINDFFEVKVAWTHGFGQEANWVFHVRCTALGSGSGDSPNLRIITVNSINSLFPSVTGTPWTPGFVEVQNLNDDSDFSGGGLSYTPGLTGGPIPSFLAVGIRSVKQAENHNRARANLPLGEASWIGTNGALTEAALELVEPIAAFAGSIRVAASTGEQWTPVTVKKLYENGQRVGVELRSVVNGNWEIDSEFTTVKSRQRYAWTAID